MPVLLNAVEFYLFAPIWPPCSWPAAGVDQPCATQPACRPCVVCRSDKNGSGPRGADTRCQISITPVASPVPFTPLPSSAVKSLAVELDQTPVVDPRRFLRSSRSPLNRCVTAPLIILGDWSPDGAFLPVYTFTAQQVSELNLAPEGPLAYPPVALRFLEASSGQVSVPPPGAGRGGIIGLAARRRGGGARGKRLVERPALFW